MSGTNPLGLAVEAMCDWLRLKLPGAVATVNSERAPRIRSLAETFNIGSSKTLKIHTSRTGTGTTVALTAGAARTAAQVAADITAAAPPGITATADAEGRVVLTGAAPTTTADSTVAVLTDTTGANALFGWDAAGDFVTSVKLAAPAWRGVTDWWPPLPPDDSQGFWVVVAARGAAPTEGHSLNRNEWDVQLTLVVLKPELGQSPHRNREGLAAATRAVLDVLLSTRGRYLGRESNGDVLALEAAEQSIDGRVVVFDEQPNIALTAAVVTVSLRVFQQ